MKNSLLVIVAIAIFMFSQLSVSASFKKSLSEEQIGQLVEAREVALDDGEVIGSMSRVLSAYVSQTSRYENRLPSQVDKVEAIISEHALFVEGDLADIKVKLEVFYGQYGASNALELEEKMANTINPPEWMGMPISTPFSGNQLEQSVGDIEALADILQSGLVKAQESAADDAMRNQKQVSEFPAANFDGEGYVADLQVQAKRSLVSGKVSDSDILNVAITSGWTAGVFPLTKIPYRTLQGSVLFKDTDDDGLCRFNGYTFISVDEGALEYKAVRGGGGGYANCDAGIAANGGLERSSGLISSTIWFLLVLVNLLGGALVLKDKLSAVRYAEFIIAKLHPHSTMIGLAAIGLGVVSFLTEFLSLNPLSNIIPQASAVLVGVILSAQFLGSKREGAGEHISKLQPFTNTLGLAAVGSGAAHLVLSGGLYFI